MVQNTRTNLPVSTEWTLVAQNVADVFISLEQRASPILVRVAESLPSVGVDDGHTLTALDRFISFIGLAANQRIYVRAITGSSKIAVS